MMDLRKSLRVAIASKGVRNIDVAEYLGYTPQQITNWLREGNISSQNITKLSEYFEMKASEFIALGEDK